MTDSSIKSFFKDPFNQIYMVVIAVVLLFCVWVFGLTTAKPNAGEVAVLIDKPWFFGTDGVRKDTVSTGRKWIWTSTQVVYVNVYPKQYDLSFEDFMSSDGIPLDFNAAATIKVLDPYFLIMNFGENWYVNNVKKEFEKQVRKGVKRYTMQQVAIDGDKSDELDDEITAALQEHITVKKLPIELIAVTLGKANPPDPVKNQRIETAQQEQRKITEVKRQSAEVNRKAAEIARADADNAYRNNMNMSAAQFIELERIKMMRETCTMKGTVCTFLIGADVAPVINAK